MHIGNTEAEFGERFSTGDWSRVGGNIQSLAFAISALSAFGTNAPGLFMDVLTVKSSLIDYGCALGDGTAALAATLSELDITGCDISADAVALAQSRWPTLKFERDDIEHPTKTARIIWTSHVLEHLADPAGTVRELLTRCQYLVAMFPPITKGDDTGPHIGAVMTDDWLPTLPDPLFRMGLKTYRTDVTSHPQATMQETSIFCVWKGDLT